MGDPCPILPAMPTTPPPAPTLAELEEALAAAALVIAGFRWRLRDAGYPFREPPAVDATIAKIDACLMPLPRRGRPAQQNKAGIAP